MANLTWQEFRQLQLNVERGGAPAVQVLLGIEASRLPFRFRLPLPPSANELVAPARGRLVKTKVAREWRKLALEQLLPLQRRPFIGPLRIRLTVVVPTISSDGRNRDKALDDALTAAKVWLDDLQVTYWCGRKRVARAGEEPHVVFEVDHDKDADPETARRITRARRG